jgi:hypothetical protein
MLANSPSRKVIVGEIERSTWSFGGKIGLADGLNLESLLESISDIWT